MATDLPETMGTRVTDKMSTFGQLLDETNDLLLMMIENQVSQEKYLRKIHYWTKLLGIFIAIPVAVLVIVEVLI